MKILKNQVLQFFSKLSDNLLIIIAKILISIMVIIKFGIQGVIIIALLLALFTGLYCVGDYIYLHSIKEFRFEQFREPKDLETYLKKNYIGKDGNELKQVFEKAGAECEVQSIWKDKLDEFPTTKFTYSCHYTAGIIGINTWQGYQIYYLVDRENKILSYFYTSIGL